MAINRYIISFILFLGFSTLTIPNFTYAEAIKNTTVTIKIDWTNSSTSAIYNNPHISLYKGSLAYDTGWGAGTKSGDYMIYKKTISRCSSASPAIDDSDWKLSIRFNETNGSIYASSNILHICGNPTYTISKTRDLSKTGGGSCSACTSTVTISGVLKQITNQGTENGFFITPNSGSSLVLGTILSSWNWTNGSVVGEKYTCSYAGKISSPCQVSCKKGTTDQAGGSSESSGSANTDTSKTNSAESIGLNITGIGIPSWLVKPRGCDADGKYTSGILKGVTCSEPVQTLGQVVTIIKNILNQILLPISGTIFTILIIAGGLIYITSHGNQKQIDQGKKAITAAIIGLLITSLAYVIITIFTTAIGGSITSTITSPARISINIGRQV